MKTTIDIADILLDQAKRIAAANGITLRELVEEALRRVIEERERRGPFHLRDATFAGDGLQPGVADGSWERIRELAYEGRGG
jgi:Arc/MetJ family transcription regulator